MAFTAQPLPFSLDLEWNLVLGMSSHPGMLPHEEAAPQLAPRESRAVPAVEHLPAASRDQHSHIPPLTHP